MPRPSDAELVKLLRSAGNMVIARYGDGFASHEYYAAADAMSQPGPTFEELVERARCAIELDRETTDSVQSWAEQALRAAGVDD